MNWDAAATLGIEPGSALLEDRGLQLAGQNGQPLQVKEVLAGSRFGAASAPVLCLCVPVQCAAAGAAVCPPRHWVMNAICLRYR